jgi:hypothetical protein
LCLVCSTEFLPRHTGDDKITRKNEAIFVRRRTNDEDNIKPDLRGVGCDFGCSGKCRRGGGGGGGEAGTNYGRPRSGKGSALRLCCIYFHLSW